MAEPDSSMRVPKGILKNKYGGGSSGGREGGRGDYAAPLHYGHGGGGVGTIPGGWDPQLGMPVAPVPAPQHGMNMPNPVLDLVMRGIKSEFPSVHQKMHEFIESKRDLLFRPLDPDETPVSEVSGAQRNNEDHYGIVPSIDHFLRIDVEEVKRHFLQNAQRGDIVIGKVISRNPSGLSLRLVCTEADKHVVLEDVNLRSFCPAHQVNPVPDPRDPSKYYDIDDFVRAEILEIHADSEKIVTGLKGETLSPELLHSVKLGLITKTELPRYYTLTVYKHSRDPRHRRTYHEMLVESPGFQNPSSVSHLALNMGIYNNANSLIRGIRTGYPPKEKAKQLRRVQNAKWAHGHVAEGIKYFKQEKFTEAFQCLNTALNIDPENIEGLVARGALYAKNGNHEKAIEDFEAALKLNPNHFNARKYLAETLVAYGRQQEGQGKLEDAIATYSKSLVVRPDHKEATEALLSLHARTEKLDPTKMTGPAAAKAAELKAKLKAILQQGELGFRMEPKSSKEKKSKKDKKKKDSSGSEDDSSSSSSSDDSSSDSSSSGSGYKKKSKKRKKKKSKKSKKSRRESGSERKPKELSLSPFSKRLAEPHGVGITSNSGFSGFTDSHYAELQLGISKHDSDNESKRSGKKSKDKKRSKKSKDKKKKKRHASSDSSSSESETERAKKKSKKHSSTENPVIQGNIPGLEDLEAKLSAYYSKIEQDKIGTNKLPSSGKSRSRSKERKRNSRSRSRSKGRAKLAKELYHDIPPRVVENVPMKAIIDDPEKNLDKPWCERKAGKIDLQTDEYGNIVQSQPQTIIRTVKNDVPVPEPSKPTKFEMKFKSLGSLEGENGNVPNVPTSDLGSKWRPLGAASSQSEAVKNAFERASSAHSNEEQKGDISSSRDDHYYRRTSRSPSRSPLRRRRRSRTRSRSRSISRSRSRSRSYSRSRSRSRSPSYRRDRRSYRRDGGQRGRAPVRFFRGYNYSRGPRRSYNPRPFPREYGNGGGNGRSRFRNRFSHTPSRSRSRSRSRSYSPRERRRDQSRDRDRGSYGREERSEKPYSQSQEATTSRMEADSSATQPLEIVPSPAAAEIQIGTMKTTSTADVEYLLDKRNAEKKEEIRKSNPEFFRTT